MQLSNTLTPNPFRIVNMLTIGTQKGDLEDKSSILTDIELIISILPTEYTYLSLITPKAGNSKQSFISGPSFRTSVTGSYHSI